MKLFGAGLIVLIALLHVGFLILEMFFWDHPVGRKMFKMPAAISAGSKVLAANQGLYNGFLAAGLLWALLADRFDLKLFFLGCVIAAGIFGALTAKPAIFFVQGVPALLALMAVLLAG